MQELSREISQLYNIQIKSVSPYKDGYIINLEPEKKYILKKSLLPEDRILFIHAAKQHLCSNGFKYIDRYICTKEGNPLAHFEGTNYLILEVIDGTECNFDNRNDLINSSKTLAAFHKASKGFVAPENSKPRDELGKLPMHFAKRLDEIKKLKKFARKGKSKFDYLFLNYVDYFIDLGSSAIEKLAHSSYSSLVEKARSEGSFCHHDFTHHNIINNNEGFYIINFDYCCFELKIYDIANLIRRKMRKCNWEIDEAKVIIDNYTSVESVNSEEFEVMEIILQFPQKFWRVINKYYNSRRSWSEKSFVSKLEEVIDETKYHKRFMEQYSKLFMS